MAEPTFYAWVEVREWGEEPREQRIGPFVAEEGLRYDPDLAEERLRRNLEEQGDIVLRIERA